MKQLKLHFIIILLLIILIIPSVALAAWWNPLTWNWNIFDWFLKPQASIVQPNQNVNQNNQPILSNSDIAQKLVSDWLNKYESSDVVDNERISDYKINSITIARTVSDCFAFNADISIQTYLTPNDSYWIAGNGTAGSDNWINDKSYVINALKQNNVYKIIGIGTAFGSESCNVPDPSFTGEPDKKQNVQTPTATQSQPSITIISSVGGETWQIGTKQTIQVRISSNMPLAGTCVDAYAIDGSGNKMPLQLGEMIGSASRTGIPFQLGIGSSANIQPGQYKVELDAHFCAETDNTFITSTTSAGYVIVTANSNFIKPTITQISPNQAGRNTIITISGSNLSGVVGTTFSQNGQVVATTAIQSIISEDQNHVTFNTDSIYSNLANPVGIYQVSVTSQTGESNSLNFTLTSQ